MATDVNGIAGTVGQIPRALSSPENERSNTAAESTQTAPNGSQDTVNLRSLGRVQELVDSVRDVPVVDATRVQQVRDALASGTQENDPARVAEKFLSLERQIAADTSVI